MNNKGIFEILKKGEKYSIVYIEKGDTLDLSEFDSKFSFDNYDAAKSYIDTNKDSLDAEVTKIKDNIRKIVEDKIAAEKAEQERKEAEWIAKGKKKEEKKARRAARKQKRKERRQKALRQWKGYVAGFLTAVIVFVGGHFAWVGISSLINKNGDGTKDNSEDEPSIEVSTVVEEEELTNENFEELVDEFDDVLDEAGLTHISDDDIENFVSIMNIDRICEDNPELAARLFNPENTTKEEYMTDVFNILGCIAQYNSDLYFNSDTKGTTEGFIDVSSVMYGEKEQKVLEYYESFVDKMAVAAKAKDREEVNRLAEEFVNAINNPTSEYSYIPDGAGLALYSSIESMINTVSRDENNNGYMEDIHTNRLIELSHSEKYISNIHRQYDTCNTKKKTR